MPPAPMTHTRLPGSTLAVRNTAPMPVVTPQPISAARSSGMSSVIFTTRVLVDEHLLGEAAEAGELVDGRAVAAAAGGARRPRAGTWPAGFEQRLGWPDRHWRHWPQKIDRQR